MDSALMEFLTKRMAGASCSAHDIDHCIRVASLATELARRDIISGNLQKDYDTDLVFEVGLLHDILDSKLFLETGREAVEEELRGIMVDSKVKNSSINRVDHILQVVQSVGYKQMLERESRNVTEEEKAILASPEYQYVQDADLLDAIGAIGICRCMAYSGKVNRSLFSRRDSASFSSLPVQTPTVIDAQYYARQQFSSEATAEQHFFDKLLRLRQYMSTPAGKIEAEARHLYMENFLQQLDRELKVYVTIDPCTKT